MRFDAKKGGKRTTSQIRSTNPYDYFVQSPSRLPE